MSARYLPTRRSAPTQLERNERLRELFQHVSIKLHDILESHLFCFMNNNVEIVSYKFGLKCIRMKITNVITDSIKILILFLDT